MKKTIAAALALAVCAVAPAASQAAPNIDYAHFKVSIKGVQTNKWSSSYQSQGKCDSSGEAHGTEVVRFETKKAQPLTAERYGQFIRFAENGLDNSITTKAKVTRQGVQTFEPTPPECEGTGGGGEPPKRDCGTKRFNWDVSPYYSTFGKKRGVQLTDSLIPIFQPFKNCPGGGVSFPSILTTKTNGKPIFSELPPKELFDKKLGKIIVLGKGKKVEDKPGLGIHRNTTVEWEVELRRVKGD